MTGERKKKPPFVKSSWLAVNDLQVQLGIAQPFGSPSTLNQFLLNKGPAGFKNVQVIGIGGPRASGRNAK